MNPIDTNSFIKSFVINDLLGLAVADNDSSRLKYKQKRGSKMEAIEQTRILTLKDSMAFNLFHVCHLLSYLKNCFKLLTKAMHTLTMTFLNPRWKRDEMDMRKRVFEMLLNCTVEMSHLGEQYLYRITVLWIWASEKLSCPSKPGAWTFQPLNSRLVCLPHQFSWICSYSLKEIVKDKYCYFSMIPNGNGIKYESI